MPRDAKSNPQLKRWFNEFNRKFFHGRLQRNTIVCYSRHNGCVARFLSRNFNDNDIALINLDPFHKRSQKLTRMSLFHEMAHQYIDDVLEIVDRCKYHKECSHGRAWKKLMRSLAARGAFDRYW